MKLFVSFVSTLLLLSPAMAQTMANSNNTGNMGFAQAAGGAGGAGGVGIGGAGGIGGLATGAATGGASALVTTTYPNPWFILGQTTAGSAPSTSNPCGVSEGYTFGPVAYTESSESPACVAYREMNMDPAKMSAWQYERMCVGSKDWLKTDKATAQKCMANLPKGTPVTHQSVVAVVAPAPTIPANCRPVPNTNAITCD